MMNKSRIKLHLADLNYPQEKISYLDYNDILDWFNCTLKGLSSTTTPEDYRHLVSEGLTEVDSIGMQATDLFLTQLVQCIHQVNVTGTYENVELYTTGEIVLEINNQPRVLH